MSAFGPIIRNPSIHPALFRVGVSTNTNTPAAHAINYTRVTPAREIIYIRTCYWTLGIPSVILVILFRFPYCVAGSRILSIKIFIYVYIQYRVKIVNFRNVDWNFFPKLFVFWKLSRNLVEISCNFLIIIYLF